MEQLIECEDFMSAAEYICRETALQNGLTIEQADDCDSYLNCTDCPFGAVDEDPMGYGDEPLY